MKRNIISKMDKLVFSVSFKRLQAGWTALPGIYILLMQSSFPRNGEQNKMHPHMKIIPKQISDKN